MSSYHIDFEFNEITKQYTIRAAREKYPLGKFVFDFLDMNIEEIQLPKENKTQNIISWHFPDISNKNYILNLILYDYVERKTKCSSAKETDCKNWLHNLQNTLSENLLTPQPYVMQYEDEETQVLKSDNFEYFFENTSGISLKFARYIDSATEFWSYYSTDKLEALLLFDYVKMREHHAIIKKCHNCGKFFIPSKRSDEIYCDRIYKANRTCKQVGYEEKEKKDPFGRLYTKARKTQYARISYNSHIKDYREKHYEPWKKAAEAARDKFKACGDIEGFKKWIEENKNSF